LFSRATRPTMIYTLSLHDALPIFEHNLAAANGVLELGALFLQQAVEFPLQVLLHRAHALEKKIDGGSVIHGAPPRLARPGSAPRNGNGEAELTAVAPHPPANPSPGDLPLAPISPCGRSLAGP